MIYPATPENISRAAQALQQGQVVAFPTETVYGLGASAFDEKAVRRVFSLKGRPQFHPLIVHVADLDQVVEVAEIPQSGALRSVFDSLSLLWPGPLTLVLPKKSSVPDIVTGGQQTVAVRIPSHPVALDLIRTTGCPLAAPSANKFGGVSPTCAGHVQEAFGEQVHMILDGGSSEIGLESTILSLVDQPPRLLRPGGISIEQVEELIGPLNREFPGSGRNEAQKSPRAPGSLKVHYRPQTPIQFREDLRAEECPPNTGFICFDEASENTTTPPFQYVIYLSQTGNLEEVARKLYSAIRECDKLSLDLIVIDSCSERGIGRAVMDRLRRACSQEMPLD